VAGLGAALAAAAAASMLLMAVSVGVWVGGVGVKVAHIFFFCGGSPVLGWGVVVGEQLFWGGRLEPPPEQPRGRAIHV